MALLLQQDVCDIRTTALRKDAAMAKTNEAGDALPLGYLLHRLVSVLRPHVSAELRELGIGLSEVVCMRLLSMNPGQSSAELARNTKVSAQAMNQVLNRLEGLGAVTRPHGSAGRTLPAKLTPEGRKLLKRAQAATLLADEQLLNSISATELRQLKRILYKAGDCANDTAAPLGR
jgi:DNA-binding MarR family transcriptional regulator